MHRALVILGKVDLGPGEAARADGMERSNLRELAERPRRPIAHAAGGNQAVHDGDELGGAFRSELHDAEVLAVGVFGIHLLRHLAHPPAPDLHLHLFVAEGSLVGFTIGDEQRVLVFRGKEVAEEHRVEENVTI